MEHLEAVKRKYFPEYERLIAKEAELEKELNNLHNEIKRTENEYNTGELAKLQPQFKTTQTILDRVRDDVTNYKKTIAKEYKEDVNAALKKDIETINQQEEVQRLFQEYVDLLDQIEKTQRKIHEKDIEIRSPFSRELLELSKLCDNEVSASTMQRAVEYTTRLYRIENSK